MAMPVELYEMDTDKGELTQLSSTVTDDQGRFVVYAKQGVKTTVGGIISKAKNLPPKVWLEFERRTRPETNVQQAKRLAAVEDRINRETIWGQKVMGWLTAQNTAFAIDRSSHVPMRYSIIDDQIYYNPELDMTQEEKIADLRQGYLSSFILRFHEELHRAQENRSRWGELWQFLRQTGQQPQNRGFFLFGKAH